MGPFRVLQFSIVVLMLFGSTWLVRLAGVNAEPSGGTGTWLSDHAAIAGVLNQGDNGDNNGGDNGDNGDSDNGDADNGDADNNDDNGNSNSNSNGNDNDSDFDDNDNFDFDLPPLPSSSSSGSSRSSGPSRSADPGCINPGQEGTFTSRDGKAAVRVFSTTPQPVRIEFLQVIDFLSAPLPPGNLVGLLAYEVRASRCDATPLAQLPAEMNLAIRYTDLEATGLDESRFVIGRLDMASGTWRVLDKRANDVSSNVVTATIGETGFYMVWESR